MSIDALFGDKSFKHRFQDDMESFYYVVLYASVIWLPHENSECVEEEVTSFFDEYKERSGKARGGVAKESNRASGKFYRLWRFGNDALKEWLEAVRLLQWPTRYGEQPEWTPKALNDQWKTTDEGNLPTNDRVNRALSRSPEEEVRETEASTSNALRESENIALPEPGSHSTDAVSRSSSKRSAEEVGFEERSDSSKRFRRSGCVPNLRDDRMRRSC